MRCKNLGLGRLSRTIICDGSPAVGKVSIISDQNHKRKKNQEKTDESQGPSNSMVYTGRC